LNKIKYDNCINIGNLSTFSEYKGKSAVKYLYDNITSYKSYKINYFIIDVTIPKYNETEFFEIIKKHNIHGLLHLNNYGETWCYSLTKSLCSQLPIFYNNIGSFKERINPNFHTVNIDNENDYIDFSKLTENYNIFLDKIIQYSTVKNQIQNVKPSFNNCKYSMYDFILNDKNEKMKLNELNFFTKSKTNITNINVENLVLITSKICVSNKVYSYSSTRSIYSPHQRYEQLLDTINSIKQYISNCYIILIDNSKLTKHMVCNLSENVDLFINDTNNNHLNYLTDENEYKGFGELGQLLYVFNNYILKNNFTFKNFFKISGRYKLIGSIEHILNIDDSVFKKNYNVTDREYYYTCFYKIINNKIMMYYKSLHRMFSNINRYGQDMEVIIPYELNYDFYETDLLNLEQNIAVWEDKQIV
jgi:hypothetical protein